MPVRTKVVPIAPRTRKSSNGRRAAGSRRRTSGSTTIASASLSGPRRPGSRLASFGASRGLRCEATCTWPSLSRTAAAQWVGPWISRPLRRAMPPSRSFSELMTADLREVPTVPLLRLRARNPAGREGAGRDVALAGLEPGRGERRGGAALDQRPDVADLGHQVQRRAELEVHRGRCLAAGDARVDQRVDLVELRRQPLQGGVRALGADLQVAPGGAHRLDREVDPAGPG